MDTSTATAGRRPTDRSRPGTEDGHLVVDLRDPDEATLVVDDGRSADDTSATPPGDLALPIRYLRAKYAASRVIAAFALILLLPVFAVTAMAIRSTSGPGVVFRQRRVGRDGEDFVILKFRTMAPDRRVTSMPVAVERRRTHKSDDDPRHHRLGRLLRTTSLDELPQLWNVVRGEMTLIGPRPELSEVADRFGFRDHPRHRVLPGIIGAWQVSEHRSAPLHEHIDVDLRYLERVSLRVDLGIVARTARLLVRPNGR